MNEKELEDARDIRAEMDAATNQHDEQVPAVNEFQVAWNEQAWAEQNAEIVRARLPLIRLPWNYLPVNIDDVAHVIGVNQRNTAAIANLAAQFAEIIATAKGIVECDEKRHAIAIEALVWRAVDEQVAAGGDKSLKLATGGGPALTRVGFRSRPGGLRIVDDEKAVEWAKEFADDPDTMLTVKTIIKPVAAAFKAHFAATSEIPDGCIIQESEDRFYIS